MCGMVAALGDWRLEEPVARLAHRGIRSKIGLNPAGVVGHVRLPIVGLGEEHDQPMVRGPWLIGFVGEILDFKEKSVLYDCDAEYAADIWKDYGPSGFRGHDGFWAIAAVNEQTDRLHVLCDYLAQKPMYYRVDLPVAASEIDALLHFRSSKEDYAHATLDQIYLSACVKWGYCPDLERTPYNEIKKVLPGEHVIIGWKGVECRTIVDRLTPAADFRNLREEMETAIKRRVLSSDVNVACLLSGGVDSAIVYKLAERHAKVTPYFVGGYDDPDYWAAVNLASPPRSALSVGPTLLSTNPPQLVRCTHQDVSVEEALGIMQEPIDLGSLRPQIALSRAVDERVCLTGDGADEVFGGYGRSRRYDSQWSDVFQELPAWHLPRLDRVMMREKIEVRSPFLARNVVRMGLAVPHQHYRQDKALLRSLFQDILPPKICRAEKRALRTPEIAHDREAYSKVLVDMFVEAHRARITT